MSLAKALHQATEFERWKKEHFDVLAENVQLKLDIIKLTEKK